MLTASSVSYVFCKYNIMMQNQWTSTYIVHADNLEKNYPANSWWDRLFIHAPFSLWHGWIVFSAVIGFFQAFTSVHEDGPGFWSRLFVIIGMAILVFTAVGYVEYKKEKGDLTGALVIALGLLAVFTNQHDPWIHWYV